MRPDDATLERFDRTVELIRDGVAREFGNVHPDVVESDRDALKIKYRIQPDEWIPFELADRIGSENPEVLRDEFMAMIRDEKRESALVSSSLLIRSAQILREQRAQLLDLWERENPADPVRGDEELRGLINHLETAAGALPDKRIATLREIPPAERENLNFEIRSLATTGDVDGLEAATVLGRLRSAIWGPDGGDAASRDDLNA